MADRGRIIVGNLRFSPQYHMSEDYHLLVVDLLSGARVPVRNVDLKVSEEGLRDIMDILVPALADLMADQTKPTG